jgi:hypothetical protein
MKAQMTQPLVIGALHWIQLAAKVFAFVQVLNVAFNGPSQFDGYPMTTVIVAALVVVIVSKSVTDLVLEASARRDAPPELKIS